MKEKFVNELKEEIVKFGSLVESMIEKSLKGLIEKDSNLLDSVVGEDEQLANSKEIDIERLCMTHIARYAPKAAALRATLMALKMNNDLERMADHCVNICRSAAIVNMYPSGINLLAIPKMGFEVGQMLESAMNAFVEEDVAPATQICAKDKDINRMRDEILKTLVESMIADPSKVEISTELLSIARNLERIADLSTNIAEDVIFMIDGVSIKHGGKN